MRRLGKTEKGGRDGRGRQKGGGDEKPENKFEGDKREGT